MKRRTALAGLSAAALCGRAVAAATPPQFVTQVAPGLYVRQGVTEDASAQNDNAIANTGFIVGRDAVCVIDPGGSAGDGDRLHQLLQRVTPLPVRYIVMTHVHPDHVFGGAPFMRENPDIIGHARLAGALAERGAYYRGRQVELLGEVGAGTVPAVTMPVAATMDLDLGGRVLTVTAHQPAHTDNDLSLFDQSSGTLWMGDLLFVDRVPSLDGNLVGWIAELDAMASLPGVQQAVPGHGPRTVAWPDAAAPLRRYLVKLRDETRRLIKRGGDIADAGTLVAQSERGAWSLFDDYNPKNATIAFKELEWE